MKRPITGKQLPKPDVKLSDAQSFDVQYGLEPVIDPSASADNGGTAGGMQFHLVECPYCVRRQLTRVPGPHATSRTARSAASRSSSASKSIMLACSSHYRPTQR